MKLPADRWLIIKSRLQIVWVEHQSEESAFNNLGLRLNDQLSSSERFHYTVRVEGLLNISEVCWL